MFVTIITDCADKNAQGRQETRAQTLFNITPSFVSLPNSLDLTATLDASGNIVDMLDASGGAEGVILANVAPRNADGKKWGNGDPFGFFRYERTLIVTTVSGYMLSLPHKLGILEGFEVIDLQATLIPMWEGGLIAESDVAYIQNSQFRSFDFLPRVAAWIMKGHSPISTVLDTATVTEAPACVWDIDCFGNVKTTLLARELPETQQLETRFGTFPIIRSLKDVPDNTAALTVGSSGLKDDRFVELVVQGKSAAEQFNIKRGDHLFG